MEEAIQTRKIEIVDSAGKVRAILGTRIPDIGPGQTPEEGPFLAFLTPAGRELVRFELEDNGREGGGYAPILYATSENGRFSTEILCENEAAMIAICSEESQRARMLVTESGHAEVGTSPFTSISGREAEEKAA